MVRNTLFWLLIGVSAIVLIAHGQSKFKDTPKEGPAPASISTTSSN